VAQWSANNSAGNETPLEYLREKGDRTGLTAYIDEIEERLIPIIGSAE
jgi:hypothetical protein